MNAQRLGRCWRSSLLLFLLLFIPSLTSAQTRFQNLYGGPNVDQAQYSLVTSGGNLLLVGESSSYGAGGTDAFVTLMTPAGLPLWTNCYGGNASDYAYVAREALDGGFIVLGQTKSFGSGSGDIYLLKLDSIGHLEWSHAYVGWGEERGYDLLVSPDGGYVITGGMETPGRGWDAYLLKVNSLGQPSWFKTYGTLNTDVGHAVVATSDAGYAIAGWTYGAGAGAHDVLLLRTDSAGTLQWSKTYGGSGDEASYCLRQLTDGGFILAGDTHSFSDGVMDAYVFRTDSLGDLDWSKHIGLGGEDLLFRGTAVDDSLLLFCGWLSNPESYDRDLWLLAMDCTGTIVLSKAYGSSADERGRSVSFLPDGSIFAGGSSTADSTSSVDILFIKTLLNGNPECSQRPWLPNSLPAATVWAALSFLAETPDSLILVTTETIVTPVVLPQKSFCPTLSAATLSIPDVYGYEGDTVDVAVNLTNPQGVSGGDLDIAFDPRMLAGDSVIAGALLDGFALEYSSVEAGHVRVSFARATGFDHNVGGTLLTIRCRVLPPPALAQVSPLQIAFAQLFTEDAQPMPSVIHNGAFHYGAQKGDVNIDGCVNAADAILCLRIAGGLLDPTELQHYLADFDGDSVVTSYDAVGILRTAVGLPTFKLDENIDAQITVCLPPVSGNAGSTVALPLRVIGLPSLTSGSLSIETDPSDAVVSNVKGSTAFSQAIVEWGSLTPGKSTVSFARATPWNNGDGIFLEVTLSCVRNLERYVPSLRSFMFYDEYGRIIRNIGLVVTSVPDAPTEQGFILHQNYPNPFNPTTEIRFHLGQEALVTVNVYDGLGRLVKTLLHDQREAGPHRILFDAAGLPSGVYYYSVSVPGHAESRRMMLLR